MPMPETCPYRIGETYYKPQHCPEKVRVPCPVCNGHKTVEVILGTGEHLIVPCEGCGLGFETSRGYIEEYVYHPRAVPFTVGSIEGFSYDEWNVRSQLGDTTTSKYLYASQAEALAASQQQADKQLKQNAESYSRTKQAAKKVTWSIRYHRECIKDLEQKIRYHMGKIGQQSSKEGN